MKNKEKNKDMKKIIEIPLSKILKQSPYPASNIIKQEILKAGKKKKNIVRIPCVKLLDILVPHYMGKD